MAHWQAYTRFYKYNFWRTYISSFVRTPIFRVDSAQSFINEAPGAQTTICNSAHQNRKSSSSISGTNLSPKPPFSSLASPSWSQNAFTFPGTRISNTYKWNTHTDRIRKALRYESILPTPAQDIQSQTTPPAPASTQPSLKGYSPRPWQSGTTAQTVTLGKKPSCIVNTFLRSSVPPFHQL